MSKTSKILMAILSLLSLIGICYEIVNKSFLFLIIFIFLFISSLLFLIFYIKDLKITKHSFLKYILLSLVLTLVVSFTFYKVFDFKNDKVVTNDKDKVSLDESNVVTKESINLSDYNTDITITKTGIYTLTGSFSHSVIIDAENENINLVLDDVTIKNEKTATIIGLNAESITITLKENTINTLSDGGNSEYDGCIYSNSKLIFNGSGRLIINGNQNEGEGIATETNDITFDGGIYEITSNDDGINAGGDGGLIQINDGTFYINSGGDGIDSNKNLEINGGTIFVIGSDKTADSGIDTDEGYTINKGTLVALGSDMIETPEKSSKQNVISFNLNEKIYSGKLITLTNDNGSVISFVSPKSFKTIIISTNTLESGNYYLYESNSNNYEYGISYENTNDNLISLNNETKFTYNGGVSLFGNNR